MSIAQVQAMLERRGYRATIQQHQATSWIVVQHGERVTHLCVPESEYVTENRPQRTARFLDERLGQGQHHMACATCKEPLLRTTNLPGSFSEKLMEGIGGRTLCYVYRSSKAGPTSPTVPTCPHCHTVLDIGTVEEIDDAFVTKPEDAKEDQTWSVGTTFSFKASPFSPIASSLEEEADTIISVPLPLGGAALPHLFAETPQEAFLEQWFYQMTTGQNTQISFDPVALERQAAQGRRFNMLFAEREAMRQHKQQQANRRERRNNRAQARRRQRGKA